MKTNSDSPDSNKGLSKMKPQSILRSVSLGIISGLEWTFYTYGCAIARRPAVFILLCAIMTAGFSVGLMKFTMEERPFKLWIPQDSDFIKVMEWRKENFPNKFRLHAAIYEADNVLNKTVLLEMLRVHEAVTNAKTENATWPSVCATMPTIIDSFFLRRRRSSNQKGANISSVLSLSDVLGRSSEPDVSSQTRVKRAKSKDGEIDWMSLLGRDNYCNILEDIQQECIEHSILEIWGYDRAYIDSLEPENIIDDINEVETSAVFGFPTNFTEFLGKIERDSEGRVVRAGASRQIWITHINLSAITGGDFVDDTGTGMEVDTIFFGVVLYGLYHGLVLLPVLLSLVGPAPYPSANQHPQYLQDPTEGQNMCLQSEEGQTGDRSLHTGTTPAAPEPNTCAATQGKIITIMRETSV